ncbi:Hsp20/alpha crystallin family protein [Actomonas aquatica]|uniref:Hsp20/alpha crystallin family protein n=1 Tax=Actomonas aquatica TaxID=2866162 RepID=A0ABZ1C4W2_9BACT|nr:Hsp20/alpha crystallin family protein [Opitutus sp. WL0086]WRQ86432.1 Hsp20/alpha crystallin family protein [Opitutus sp. WL0086]
MNLLNSIIPAFHRSPAVRQGHRDEDLGATIKPHYEIKETEDAYGLTVQLPGVNKAGLEITAEDTTLRLVGKRAWTRPAGWTALYRETTDATYLLELDHDNAIDLDKIRAELNDGVLRVSLPKAEAIKPRKIAVS